MRGVFGLAGLLIALLIIGLLVKKELNATQRTLPTMQQPAAQDSAGQGAAPAGMVVQQSRQFEQQYKNALQGALRKSNPAPDGDSQ